jgi:hypothetical protein
MFDGRGKNSQEEFVNKCLEINIYYYYYLILNLIYHLVTLVTLVRADAPCS